MWRTPAALRYTASGFEGLLEGERVFALTGRGGFYGGDEPAKVLDFQEHCLRGILGFLGLTDVTFIHVEGLNISPEAACAHRDRLLSGCRTRGVTSAHQLISPSPNSSRGIPGDFCHKSLRGTVALCFSCGMARW
jgi:hypothetical protein